MTSALSNSVCSESIPGALPLFIALIAVSIWEAGLMLMSISFKGSGSAGSLGSGRLSASSKC